MSAPVAADGPNQVIPTTNYTTANLFCPVRIRIGEKDSSRWTPTSLPTVLEMAARTAPDRVALAFKVNPDDRDYEYITFSEYLTMTKTVAKAFLKLGLQKLHSVAIMGFNSPEWFLAYLGSIYAGGVACGVYTTNSAEATFYCLENAYTNVAVVEDDEQAQKILRYKMRLPKLKAVIQYRGEPVAPGVISWEEFLNIGNNEDDFALQEALKKIAINECCTLIYTSLGTLFQGHTVVQNHVYPSKHNMEVFVTEKGLTALITFDTQIKNWFHWSSGTTGNPKGVMLTHDNLIWNARSTLTTIGLVENERIISYLPLSHVAALLVDVYCHLLGQVTVYFANKDALKGGLINTLLEVKPTRFLGVPRIWEKISEKMKVIGSEAGMLKRHVAAWAKGHGLQRNLDLMKGNDSPTLGYLLARNVVFSKIKSKMGFDYCRTYWSGAAPLATDIKLYLASLDIPILDAYGMSESSGVHTININSAFKFDSAGRTIPGAKTKIVNADENGEGEICMYGRHVFMGYVDDPEGTETTIDQEGYLHTGDIGKVDPGGFLYITGRIKELLITAGGENISPILIEQNVKAELPFLGQAVVICERKKFLSLLVTFSSEIDPISGEATDELTQIAQKWLKSLGFTFEKTSELIASGPDDKILAEIQKGIDAANRKAISNAQRIQKFAILPKDFSISSGELGPTLKLKRNVINEKYKDVIDKFYED